jgi:hypothetical protein
MMVMIWNDVKLGNPPLEGNYLVYKYYPYTDKYELAIETFKAKLKIDYTTDNKQILYKKFTFTKTGRDPQEVKFWMFLPEIPKIS